MLGLARVAEALSKPTEKLIGEVSKGIGALYRPRAIRLEGQAEAAKLLAMERAKAQADEARKDIALAGQLDRLAQLTAADPEIIQRAKARLALQEIQGQVNIETIADQSIQHLPAEVSDEPLGEEWRQRFFKLAADVSEQTMQELWAKVLAGEVAEPSTFSVRTLDVLHKLSRSEAELFSRFLNLCPLGPYHGAAKLKSHGDYGFTPYGVDYSGLMRLKDAGLVVHEQNLVMTWPVGTPGVGVQFRGRNYQLTFKPNVEGMIEYVPLSLPGEELAKVVQAEPLVVYLEALQERWNTDGFAVRMLYT